MARKKKAPEKGPSNAYLVSFGDTMTTLLAFFIVLCSLAEEQSGANLHRGTGSFIRALNSGGLPGMFSSQTSSQAITKQETNALYIAESESGETEKNPSGPDEDNGLRSIDREAEQFQRLLNEMGEMATVESMPKTKGEITFDFFRPFKGQPPFLTGGYTDVFSQVIPVLRRSNYRVEIVVWATTPSDSAWERAVRQSESVSQELADFAGLKKSQRSRLEASGRPWLYSDIKRPQMSIVIRKIDA